MIFTLLHQSIRLIRGWGIYTRHQSEQGKFRLSTITLDRDRAIEEGRALMKQSKHPIDVAIQGATSAAGLADTFMP